MSYFLLIYDQRRGVLEALEEFPEAAADAALARRFELERDHREESGVEVVLLGAPSQDALRKTHARYFKTVRELAADLDHELAG